MKTNPKNFPAGTINMEAILNNIPGGIAVYELGKTLKTLKYTDGIPKMQGFTREEYDEVVMEDAMNIVYEEDRTLLEDTIAHALQSMEQIHLSYRVYCKDRSVIWVNLSAYPADFSENNEPIYYAIFSSSTPQFNLYRDICDNSSTGVLVVDIETGMVHYANHILLKIAGCPALPKHKITTSELFSSTMTADELKMLQQDKSEFIHKITSNQKVLHLHSRKILWMARPSILLYATDITAEYHKQEDLLRRYQDQVNYNRMLSSTSLASSMVNLTKNCITLQASENSELMTVITQRTPQEGFDSMYAHIIDAEIRRDYKSIFNTETVIADFHKGTSHKSIRHPFDTPDYWMESSYDVVRNPRTGDLEMYCFARDVTQEVLQQDVSKAFMTMDYEDVILVHIATQKPAVLIRSKAAAFYDALEKSQNYEQTLQHFLAPLLADVDAAQILLSLSMHNILSALETQKTYSVSLSIKKPGQRLQRKRLSFSYLNQYKTFLLFTTQDTTADFESELAQREALQSALNRAQEATKAKTTFLANMSHDMRTPMNAILGLANLGMDLENLEEIKDYLTKIYASGKQLLDLINDTLDISRIENGKLTLNAEYITSSQILLETVASSRIVAEQKGVHFEVVKDGMQECNLYVDKSKIVKIFTNLLSNAIKFTPVGGRVVLTVKRLYPLEMDTLYEISVKDTGIGMSTDFLPHIYEPFSQERLDYSTNTTGTGLGMTIVKELVNFLGGSIDIKSVPDCGTEVVVRMKFRRAKDQSAIAEPQHPRPTLLLRKVLVAEDHPLNAKIIEKLLDKFGYIPVLAENGQDCIRLFSQSSPYEYAAILMDIRMPVMDGLTATRTIRSLETPDAASIPIIAMTANAFAQDVQDCLAAGMNKHLSKPIDPDALHHTLDTVIPHLNVLLIEDSPFSQSIEQQLLEKMGYSVDIAVNGLIGCDLFCNSAEGYYDVILMDIRMPIMNGLEATRLIRSMNRKDARTIPIIAVTANAFPEDIQKSLDAGMNGHLSKPVDGKELYNKILAHSRK